MKFYKQIIFLLCLFLVFGGFLNYTEAGDIRGTCTCGGCTETDLGETFEGGSVQGTNSSVLQTVCNTNCEILMGEDRCNGNRVSEKSCVISTETENSSGVCAPSAPSTPSTTSTPTETIPIQGIDLPTPLGTTSVPVILGRIIKGILGVVGSIALLMFIVGGFYWLTAAGVPDRVEKGKNTLIYATIGLTIIFISYALVNFVINTITSVGA